MAVFLPLQGAEEGSVSHESLTEGSVFPVSWRRFLSGLKAARPTVLEVVAVLMGWVQGGLLTEQT